MKIGKLNYVV